MKIILKNFKCYKDAIYEIQDDKITLLSGVSGSGKSSIIQSICWCLYGKIRGVYNNKTTAKCSVTLLFNGIKIYRQARPNLLQITLNDNSMYEDIVAQQIIDSKYGERSLWYACSYVEQDSKAALLTGTNADRMNLLNVLSFSNSDPAENINRIDTELKAQKKEFERIQTEYTTELNIFNTEATLDPAIFSYYLNSEELKEQKKNELISNQKIYEKLLEEQKNQNQYLGKISLLEQSLYSKNNELHTLKNKQTEFISNNKILSDDYDDRIQVIQDKKNKLTEEYTKNNSIKEHEINDLNQELQNYSEIVNSYKSAKERIDMKLRLKINEKEKIENDLESYNNYIKMYYENINKFKENQIQYNDIIDIVNKLGMNYFSNDDIWKIQNEEKKYDEMNKLANELEFDYLVPSDTDDDNDQMTKQIIEQKMELLNNHKNKLSQEIDQLNKMEQEFKIQQNLISLENIYKDLKDINEVTNDDIQKCNERIHILKQGLNILECPHCNGSLRIQGTTLIPSDLHKVDQSKILEEETILNELYQQKNKYQEKINLEKQIKSLRNMITTDNFNDFDMTKIKESKNNLMTKLKKYERLEIMNKPKYSSKLVSKYLEYINLKNNYDIFLTNNDITKVENKYKELKDELTNNIMIELDKIKEEVNLVENNNDKESFNKLNEIEKKIFEKKNEIRSIKTEYDRNYKSLSDHEIRLAREKSQNEINKNNLMILINRISEYEDEIEKITNELNQYKNILIHDIDQQIKDISIKISDNATHLHKSSICENLYKKQTQLNNKRNIILKIHNDIIKLGTMRQIAVDLECKLLQSNVDRINLIMNEILDNIFEHPITVTLKLYKQIKSNKRIKPTVNLTVSYKGVDYDGINMLSGGESDRISLALIIAMSRISTSPFLLLDEAMKSINDSLRFDSIKSLRNILGDRKTIICVNHEDTEGNYDHVIPID